MGKLERKKIQLVFFLQLMFLLSLTTPMVQGTNPYGNLDKMDDALESALQTVGDLESSFEVIFQLNSPVTDDDINFMKNVGATYLDDAKLIDGGLIDASPDVIR
mgnify:FL=1